MHLSNALRQILTRINDEADVDFKIESIGGRYPEIYEIFIISEITGEKIELAQTEVTGEFRLADFQRHLADAFGKLKVISHMHFAANVSNAKFKEMADEMASFAATDFAFFGKYFQKLAAFDSNLAKQEKLFQKAMKAVPQDWHFCIDARRVGTSGITFWIRGNSFAGFAGEFGNFTAYVSEFGFEFYGPTRTFGSNCSLETMMKLQGL